MSSKIAFYDDIDFAEVFSFLSCSRLLQRVSGDRQRFQTISDWKCRVILAVTSRFLLSFYCGVLKMCVFYDDIAFAEIVSFLSCWLLQRMSGDRRFQTISAYKYRVILEVTPQCPQNTKQ